MSHVKVYINGKVCPQSRIDDWERKRVEVISKQMNKALGTPEVHTASELTDLKMSIPDEKLREMCAKKIKSSDRSTTLLQKISKGNTVNCVIEMDVEGASAQEMKDQYFSMMFNNTEENRRLNLSANPDHISLIGKPGQRQDVVEASAAMPMQSQFDVCFGDETGMHSTPDPDYPVQCVGNCRTSDGLVIGGCRHQFRDTPTGCHAKLVVEFPAKTPKKYIAQHQLHLACEFSNWINAWVDRAQAARKAAA